MLGCAESAIQSPAAIASVGSPKLLVEMANTEALRSLRPKLDTIVHWGKAAGVNGIYAYAPRKLNAYEGRNFNHLDEQLEDAATGVAAGALSLFLAKDITLYQGMAQGNPCRISASHGEGLIHVGGQVVEA